MRGLSVPLYCGRQRYYGMTMIVVSTNTIIKAFRTRDGASHALRHAARSGGIRALPTFMLEYEDVLKRPGLLGTYPAISAPDVDEILDALCIQARRVSPWFRFRPVLDDTKDGHVVECALAAPAPCAIVRQDRHFRHPHGHVFGLQVIGVAYYVSRIRLP